MNNRTYTKIGDISGWLLLAVLVLYFISGYAMMREHGMETLMNRQSASWLHNFLIAPFFVFLFLHIVPYYYVRKKLKRMTAIALAVLMIPMLVVFAVNKLQTADNNTTQQGEQTVNVENQPDNKTIQCDKCPCRCLIKPCEKGACGKIKNVDGRLVPME